MENAHDEGTEAQWKLESRRARSSRLRFYLVVQAEHTRADVNVFIHVCWYNRAAVFFVRCIIQKERDIYLYSSISLWFCPTSRAALYWVPHRKAIGTVCNRLAIHQSAAKPTAMFAAAADHSLFSPSDPLLLNLAVACRCCSLHYRRSLILFRPPPPPRLLSVVGGRQ